ncbi:hypothetical protein WDU94_000803 [Cyamophila willieti]
MKFNDKELHALSKGPCDLEGRLSFKKTHSPMISSSSGKSGFKERWFKLKHNLLFYFKTNDIGQIDYSQPAGMFVLENSSVYPESSAGVPFAFSLVFKDEPDKRYIISTRSEQDVAMWMSALKKVSYEYLRSQLVILQDKIKTLTGMDPLLLVPRNKPTLYSTSSSYHDNSEDFYSSKRNHVHISSSITHTSSRQVLTQSTRQTSSNFTTYTSKQLSQPDNRVPVANLIDL